MTSASQIVMPVVAIDGQTSGMAQPGPDCDGGFGEEFHRFCRIFLTVFTSI